MIEGRTSAVREVHAVGDPHRLRTFYLKCFFEDGTSAPDTEGEMIRVDHTNLASLRVGLANATGDSDARLTIHRAEQRPTEPEAPSPQQAEEIMRALPTLLLDDVSAAALLGEACAVCLEEYACGSQLVCVACPGRHIAHAGCTARWIATAAPATCPSCRFRLPDNVASVGSAESITSRWLQCLGGQAAATPDLLQAAAARLRMIELGIGTAPQQQREQQPGHEAELLMA